MSRIGKLEIEIPDGVEVKIEEITLASGEKSQKVIVKGSNGELSRTFRPEITVSQEDKQLKVTRRDDEKLSRSLHGLSRTLLSNMVVGVSKGYSKQLNIVGVGYRATLKGASLDMQLGLSHPVVIDPPEGIKFALGEGNTSIIVSGPDKEIVGQVAANIRSLRPPEPYKGKGIHYLGERIKRKAGKSGAKAA